MDSSKHLFPTNLDETLQLYLTVLNTNPNGIFIYDIEGNLVDCNDTACRLHGYSKEEMMRMGPRQFIHPDGMQTFLAFSKAVARGEEFLGESCGVRKNGEKFFVEVFGKQITVNQKKYLFSTIRDISALKEQLKTIKEYEENLQQLVEEKSLELIKTTTKLNKMQKQLFAQEKLAYFGSLIAGIAHEIKNPLHIAINSSLIVKAWVESKVEANNRDGPDGELLAKEMCSLTVKNIKRADKTIQSILSQLKTDRPTTVLANINSILQESLSLAFHSMKIKYDYKPLLNLELGDIPNSLLYSQDLKRAFINIFENSFYALYQKTLSDKYFNPQIIVESNLLRDEINISIKDNGSGVEENILSKLKKPFFTTKPAGEGTGLGLSIVQDIIEGLQEGSFYIESKKSQYTNVKINIPFILAEEAND